MIFNNIYELIGNTPMIKLNRLTDEGMAEVLVKLESFNPGSSVKDRIALSMIEKAEELGLIKPGDTIIEPTSGNTGIGLAMVGAAKGYKVILVMPETMSIERRKLMKAYGAELVLTDGKKGMRGAVEEADRLAKENGYFMPQQFKNIANPQIHMKTTAQEILKQTEGKIDMFIAGVGTGGTITGVGRILKREIPNIKIVAVEPKDSPVLSGGQPGPHKIQGIGAGFIPDILDKDVIDEVITVTAEQAFQTSRKLAKKEGILVGISSGAAIFVALSKAMDLGKGKRIVTVAPDTGERYLSTDLFEE
ncbi:cysteine synthase A [Caloramator sp. Dgby_cultured_2]|uniref:cysteine synthase A n=1 Tax=Caloramator sp. Dgby_cultured_2 TaxID=3029174 RepID=UPI00237E1106|nr:cysteine synthase A [Caloramator sp. Dgby_cultured_2]WDU83776.1 cysteine synthase A [Caloramator sp. Dgby_cultured_2]